MTLQNVILLAGVVLVMTVVAVIVAFRVTGGLAISQESRLRAQAWALMLLLFAASAVIWFSFEYTWFAKWGLPWWASGTIVILLGVVATKNIPMAFVVRERGGHVAEQSLLIVVGMIGIVAIVFIGMDVAERRHAVHLRTVAEQDPEMAVWVEDATRAVQHYGDLEIEKKRALPQSRDKIRRQFEWADSLRMARAAATSVENEMTIVWVMLALLMGVISLHFVAQHMFRLAGCYDVPHRPGQRTKPREQAMPEVSAGVTVPEYVRGLYANTNGIYDDDDAEQEQAPERTKKKSKVKPQPTKKSGNYGDAVAALKQLFRDGEYERGDRTPGTKVRSSEAVLARAFNLNEAERRRLWGVARKLEKGQEETIGNGMLR